MTRASLELRQSQHLALTPQLQQSIRLLQLSSLELEAEIAQALSENPLLEREGEDDPGGPLGTEPGQSDSPDTQAQAEPSDADAAYEREVSFEQGMRGAGGQGDDDEPLFPEAARAQTLREHLVEQLQTTRASQRDMLLTELLIDELDENGFLASTLEEILGWLPPELEVELEELQAALALLRSFDPPGIGAFDVQQCLGLQLRDPDVSRLPEAADRQVLAVARELCAHHLSLLASGSPARLREALRCSDETLRAARALILRLDPRPGRAWTVAAADYAVPDVIAHRARHGWRAVLNTAVMPRLRINAMYAQVLGNARSGSGNPALQSQLQQARWLVRNVEQRYDTILRVSQAIVERQSDFFSQGPGAMRPLILKDIAGELGLHESTISRATTQKFMLTPFGTMELKRFFGAGVATETGGAASATAVQAQIRQMVAEEPAGNPLSDSQIMQMLSDRGIVIARRTVAKYREALRIAPAAVRKAQASLR
ncbi:RNA polymerase factor sigma-54 [Orrella sp. JC864]|uniref:RNA polymerase factor sigma-54 n=1 Tax=Orrella sp. JC864 TaxID=3120298 RepID=UPI0012BBA9A7